MESPGKKIHFVSGMPRSGSTLLCNVLAQNPNWHATATSGILDIVMTVRNRWGQLQEFMAIPEAQKPQHEETLVRVMKSILNSYFENVDKPVIFDKSRGWLAHLETAEKILGRKPKVIVPVRDLRDILASFEKLYRKTKDTKLVSQEGAFPARYATCQGRCSILASEDQIVGASYNRVKDAYKRGWKDCMLFVDYDRLTSAPQTVIREIYEFLDEPFYDGHDFDHVEQVTQEDDSVHIWKSLHVIRPRIEPQKSDHAEILGDKVSEIYTKNSDYWKKLMRGNDIDE